MREFSFNSKIYTILCFILLCLIFIRPGLMVFNQRNSLVGGYAKRYESLRTTYYSSQYVKKDKPAIITDGALEAFAGGAFIKGLNPILIVHDQPPLGRYITGLSILIFDNANTGISILLFFSALGIFFIAKEVTKNTLFSLIPVAIFVNEPLFIGKLQLGPLLEPTQLPFIVFSLYFFMRGVSSKNYVTWFILTSLMIGFVISIRFFILGLVLASSMAAYLIVSRMIKKTVFFLVSLLLSILVLIFSYTRTILDGYGAFHVFGIQKYIFVYHQSQFVLPFTFWDLLFFNRWHTWWGDRSISSDVNWIVLWPLASLIIIFFSLLVLVKKAKFLESEKILLLWVIFYSVSLSAGISTTRYFLPLVPFLYILSVSFLMRLTVRLLRRKNNYAKQDI